MIEPRNTLNTQKVFWGFQRKKMGFVVYFFDNKFSGGCGV